jgi:hypothetical protein
MLEGSTYLTGERSKSKDPDLDVVDHDDDCCMRTQTLNISYIKTLLRILFCDRFIYLLSSKFIFLRSILMLSFNLFLSLLIGCLPDGLHIKIIQSKCICFPTYPSHVTEKFTSNGRPYIKPFNNTLFIFWLISNFATELQVFRIWLTHPSQNNHFRYLLFLLAAP